MQDHDVSALPTAAIRCLRSAASRDHRLASQLHNRSKHARTAAERRRMAHLCAMSALCEARAADLIRETR